MNSLSPEEREEQALTLFSAFLALDDSQKPRLKALMDDALQEAGNLTKQQTSLPEDALFAAAKAQKSDDELQKLAGQQATLSAQALALQARTLSRIITILRDDQKAMIDLFLYRQVASFLAIPQ